MSAIRKDGLTLEVLEQLAAMQEAPAAAPAASHSVRQVLNRIHRDLFDLELNVKTLKARCGWRDNNISTLFRQGVGMSIRDYIEEQRMRAALLLLDRTTLAATEIGHMVGFANPQTFYRAFKRRFDCTPVEYNSDPYRTRLHPVAG